MMRLRHALVAVAVGGGAVFAAMACGPGELHKLMEGYPAELEPGQDPGDPCKHAYPPAAPAGDAAIAGDKPTSVTFAFNDMRLDTSSTPASGLPPPVAYDLDHTCSCQPDAAPSCVKKTTQQTGTACSEDDAHGAENVVGKLLDSLEVQVPAVGPDALKSRIDKGFFSLLVNISNWNGTQNDDRVTVAVFTSPGLVGRDGTDATLPKRDGSDHWHVDPGSTVGGVDQQVCQPPDCFPVAVDAKTAYVSKGKLVATFDALPFAFGDGVNRIAIPLASALLVAKIDGTDESSYTMEGDLAGRWASHDILQAMGKVALQDDDGGVKSVCQPADAAKYLFLYDYICGAADLAPKRGQDNTKAACTSLSQALHFRANVAQIGTVQTTTTEINSALCSGTVKTDCE